MKAREVNCGEVAADLLAGFRGELSPPEAESLETHLAACPACMEEDAGIRALTSALGDLPEIEPSEGSWSKMRRMIEEDAPTARARRRVLPIAFAAGLAAALLLLVFLLSPSPVATLAPLAGNISVDGRDLAAASDPVDLRAGAVIAAAALSRVGLVCDRDTDLTLAPGTRLEVKDEGTLNLIAGRILVSVAPGRNPLRFRADGGTVVVTGTVFDLSTGSPSDARGNVAATVTVIEGEVEVRRAGHEPARVIRGQSCVIADGPDSMRPVPADPWRVRDWCSAPTPRLKGDGRKLRLTLANETVAPLHLKPFDPAAASYYIHLEGPSGRMDLKVQESMVIAGGRRPGDPEVLTLAPGEATLLLIDLGRIDLRSLGVSPGTYRVTVHYRPYPPLPADAWRGRLEAGPVTLRVE